LVSFDPDLYEAAWEQTAKTHQEISPALRLEEEICYLLHSPRNDRLEQIQKLFRSAIVALQNPDRPGLAHWAARALPRFPPEIRVMEEARMLSAGASFRLNESLTTTNLISEGQATEWMTWMAPANIQRSPIGVRLYPDLLEIGPAEILSDGKIIDLPKTDPLVLEIGLVDETSLTPKREATKKKVYVSYRQDNREQAQRIVVALNNHLYEIGNEDIIFDSFSLATDAVWEELITNAIFSSRIMILLIPPSWNQFDDLNDSVMRETALAFKRGIKVIPLLMNEARMPSTKELPADLADLPFLNALHIREKFFEMDILKLVRDIRNILNKSDGYNDLSIPESFKPIYFNEGDIRQIPASSSRVLLRTVIGEEYLLSVKPEPEETCRILLVCRDLALAAVINEIIEEKVYERPLATLVDLANSEEEAKKD